MTLGDATERLRNLLVGESDADTAADATGATADATDATADATDEASAGVRDRLPGVTRRSLLAGVLGVGAAKAADNVLVGYGILTGTNLQRQDVGALATERLQPSPFEVALPAATVSLGAGALSVDGDASDLGALSPSRGRELDYERGLAGGGERERGPFEELAADWNAIAGPADVTVRPTTRAAFFEDVAAADSRPFTVQALRGNKYHPATPETVRAFAAVDPERPAAVVDGLMHGFNERTSYDVPRYVAGSVEDNVIFGAADLREHFQDPVTFDALLNQNDSGMFCYEFVHRSIDALHAVPPHRQRNPVFAGVVTDKRHKHVYTVLASAYREDDELVLPITFVDYTHSTLYDDFAADVVLGDGVNAYDSRHRATDIYWNGYRAL